LLKNRTWVRKITQMELQVIYTLFFNFVLKTFYIKLQLYLIDETSICLGEINLNDFKLYLIIVVRLIYSIVLLQEITVHEII